MDKIFKAKRLDNGEWVEFWLVNYHGRKDSVFIESLKSYVEIDDDTICQYTGKNDSEGNKIFEGDELEYKENGKVDGYSFYVEWNKEDVCFDGDSASWRWKLHKLTGRNIYDKDLG